MGLSLKEYQEEKIKKLKELIRKLGLNEEMIISPPESLVTNAVRSLIADRTVKTEIQKILDDLVRETSLKLEQVGPISYINLINDFKEVLPDLIKYEYGLTSKINNSADFNKVLQNFIENKQHYQEKLIHLKKEQEEFQKRMLLSEIKLEILQKKQQLLQGTQRNVETINIELVNVYEFVKYHKICGRHIAEVLCEDEAFAKQFQGLKDKIVQISALSADQFIANAKQLIKVILETADSAHKQSLETYIEKTFQPIVLEIKKLLISPDDLVNKEEIQTKVQDELEAANTQFDTIYSDINGITVPIVSLEKALFTTAALEQLQKHPNFDNSQFASLYEQHEKLSILDARHDVVSICEQLSPDRTPKALKIIKDAARYIKNKTPENMTDDVAVFLFKQLEQEFQELVDKHFTGKHKPTVTEFFDVCTPARRKITDAFRYHVIQLKLQYLAILKDLVYSQKASYHRDMRTVEIIKNSCHSPLLTSHLSTCLLKRIWITKANQLVLEFKGQEVLKEWGYPFQIL